MIIEKQILYYFRAANIGSAESIIDNIKRAMRLHGYVKVFK